MLGNTLDAPFTRWFAGKQFTVDWASGNFGNWAKLLVHLREHKSRGLEIGSWEGRSAVFFLEYLPRCRLTCVDTFEGSAEHPKGSVDGIEHRFDANIATYGSRVEKIKMPSHAALAAMVEARRAFDFVYVDGSHKADDVWIDSTLSWTLLKEGGVIIWDDYEWYGHADPPRPAIDRFLQQYRPEILHKGYQIAAKKVL
jgi:predicted O-methyltransferase YrrM